MKIEGTIMSREQLMGRQTRTCILNGPIILGSTGSNIICRDGKVEKR
jgi:hypothetical protein